ncbi:hypothetical protein MLD38_008981 [Melastoma candidum]|uniref:Uncharacterized protein n=1 Tax=Melastoma candidum TaxID=119954 RepID=A0ACB9S0E3_9MYRT|nr:hypothetical protein MLD38_008981 [Melastoma candidum]
MIIRTLFSARMVRRVSNFVIDSQRLCMCSCSGGEEDEFMEDPLRKMWVGSESEAFMDDEPILNQYGLNSRDDSFRTVDYRDYVEIIAQRVFEVLRQDGPGFDTKAGLDELRVGVSGLLVRKVLLRILRSLEFVDKVRFAKLGYKFFTWSSKQEKYTHSADAYHLMMKILAQCDEFKSMWKLVDEMIEKGFPTTARTFNILICACGEVGLARDVVERFIKSKTFNYRPYKHSYNAILHSLVAMKEYKLIEWVYQQMLDEGLLPDILTYNIVMCAKYRLGKLDQFHRLLDDLGRQGLSPDFHTYNLLLHVLGKGDKPLAALNLLNHMRETGVDPGVIHFTTLMDGFSRAGNLDACKYFFEEMVKSNCVPDVVCYTVFITGYVVAGKLEKAKGLFNEMIRMGQIPNVFTYNSMIRGYCMAGDFDDACLLLKEMEARGCNPNFMVYSTLVGYLQNAGKMAEAHDVIRHMVDKGQYVHLTTKFRSHRRC